MSEETNDGGGLLVLAGIVGIVIITTVGMIFKPNNTSATDIDARLTKIEEKLEVLVKRKGRNE